MKTSEMSVSILLLLVVAHAWGQRTGPTASTASGFVVDPAKPYVYLQLDHVGPRQPRGKDEPSVGIYLRLINNTRLTVVVSTIGGPAGSSECDLTDEVVSNPKPLITMSGGKFIPSPSAREPHNQQPQQEPPLGYVSEVQTTTPIPPGGQIYFSVPINHVGSTWHFEIPFRFDLPRTHQRQPKSYVSFFEDDLPPKDLQSVPPAK